MSEVTAHILVIDDDPRIVNLLQQTLEAGGYEVAGACDGNQGMRLFRENPADLVIVDLIMPEKEGMETIQELRGERGTSSALPRCSPASGHLVTQSL